MGYTRQSALIVDIYATWLLLQPSVSFLSAACATEVFKLASRWAMFKLFVTFPLVLTFSPWRLFRVSGSPWTLPISSSCGRECWRPSAHSFWCPSWWCPCILISVFLAVSHLLPPCPALFWWYGIHLSVWHVHTSVVVLHQVCCYRLNCCCFPDLFISFVLSQANTLYPSQHSYFSLIHQHLILHFLPIGCLCYLLYNLFIFIQTSFWSLSSTSLSWKKKY